MDFPEATLNPFLSKSVDVIGHHVASGLNGYVLANVLLPDRL